MCALLNFQLLLPYPHLDRFLLLIDMFQDHYTRFKTHRRPTSTETFSIFGVIWKGQSQFIVASVVMRTPGTRIEKRSV
jgi:hypothetical protein